MFNLFSIDLQLMGERQTITWADLNVEHGATMQVEEVHRVRCAHEDTASLSGCIYDGGEGGEHTT